MLLNHSVIMSSSGYTLWSYRRIVFKTKPMMKNLEVFSVIELQDDPVKLISFKYTNSTTGC